MTLIPHGDTLEALRLQGVHGDPTSKGYVACPHRDGRFVGRFHCPKRCDPSWAPCVGEAPVVAQSVEVAEREVTSPAIEPDTQPSGPKRVPLADLDAVRAHPVADAFPMLGETGLRDLAASIREHGQQQPLVVTWDEQSGERTLLDGRNRLAACRLAGIDPLVEEWGGTGDPTGWVLSINLDRRHLSTSQRAAVAVGLMPLLEEAARRRMLAGADPRAKLPKGSEADTDTGRAREQAGQQVNVSPRYVADACRIAAEDPAVLALVRAGTLGIQDAKRALKLDAGARAKVVAKAQDVDPSNKNAVGELGKSIREALKAASAPPEPEPGPKSVRQPDSDDDAAQLAPPVEAPRLAAVEALARRLALDEIRALVHTLTALLVERDAA